MFHYKMEERSECSKPGAAATVAAIEVRRAMHALNELFATADGEGAEQDSHANRRTLKKSC